MTPDQNQPVVEPTPVVDQVVPEVITNAQTGEQVQPVQPGVVPQSQASIDDQGAPVPPTSATPVVEPTPVVAQDAAGAVTDLNGNPVTDTSITE